MVEPIVLRSSRSSIVASFAVAAGFGASNLSNVKLAELLNACSLPTTEAWNAGPVGGVLTA